MGSLDHLGGNQMFESQVDSDRVDFYSVDWVSETPPCCAFGC